MRMLKTGKVRIIAVVEDERTDEANEVLARKIPQCMKAIKKQMKQSLNGISIIVYENGPALLRSMKDPDDFVLTMISIGDNSTSLLNILRRIGIKTPIIGVVTADIPPHNNLENFNHLINVNADTKSYTKLINHALDLATASNMLDQACTTMSSETPHLTHNVLLQHTRTMESNQSIQNPMISVGQSMCISNQTRTKRSIDFDNNASIGAAKKQRTGNNIYSIQQNDTSATANANVNASHLVSPPRQHNFNPDSSDDEMPLHLPPSRGSMACKSLMEKYMAMRANPTAPNSPWTNILSAAKVIVTMESSSQDLVLRHVSSHFTDNFQFSSEDISNHCIEALVGPGTSRITINKLKAAMKTGSPVAEYINLYRKDGVPLSCFVALQVLQQSLENIQNIGFGHIAAILTIRSASAIGNSKFCGIGLLNTDGISQEKRSQILHNKAEESYENKVVKIMGKYTQQTVI
eukprot:gene1001-1968_t